MDFREFLDRDEQVLWQGRPHLGVMFHGYDVFAIPFSLLWGGGVFAFTIFGLTEGIPENLEALDLAEWALFSFLFVGVFVIAAIYITVGRFIVDIVRRGRTHYAVTNRRALIYGGLFVQELSSQHLTRGLQVRITGQRRGSIKFGQGSGLWGVNFAFWYGPSHPFMFERIRDVREVYALVRRVQESA